MSSYLEFSVANAFGNEVFTGNPTAVFYKGENISDELMQSIARQMNLVETVFVLQGKEGEYDFELKYFTPNKELPIAGHPTISTFASLLNNNVLDSNKNIFKIKNKAGIQDVKISHISGEILFEQPIPVYLDIVKDLTRISNIFSVEIDDIDNNYPIQAVTTGLGHLIVPFKNLSSLMKAKRNIHLLKELCLEYGVQEAQLFTFETYNKKYNLHTRNICPREGIEDPACGTGTGALLAYLDKNVYLDKKEFSLKVEQGNIVKMPSLVDGYVKNGVVTTGGKGKVMIDGKFYIK